MKHLISTLVLVLSIPLLAQNSPKIMLKDSSELKITSLKIDVDIVGNFVTTTYDMEFYNGLDRTLEGELVFPLSENQSVFNFAMEVNGKLRNAVVVEKELARVAYENTIRQEIDPGLLEKTQGNNYKARVYPILPKSGKRIVITYEEELFLNKDNLIFELPLNFKEELSAFSLKINMDGIDEKPIITKNKYLKFIKNENGYLAKVSRTNFKPNKPILIEIPIKSSVEKVLTYQDYFYINLPIKPSRRIKSKPKKITVLWDASYSLRLRQLDKELDFLGQYIEYLKDVEVQFISFSNDIREEKNYPIKNGIWTDLQSQILNTSYDGGTSYAPLDSEKIKGEEVLLFSDGLYNLGNLDMNQLPTLYTLNSVVSSNQEYLNYLSLSTGGHAINLNRFSAAEALELIQKETYQYLGYSPNDNITEVYPKTTNVKQGFSVKGKFNHDTTIELFFGYGGKVSDVIIVPIHKKQNSPLVKRLWAREKLKFLNLDKEKNKKDIIELGTRYHLISDYTSLLILDRIEDYVRYKIEPPAELKAEYKLRLKELDEEENHRKEALENRRKNLFSEYKSLVDWYKKDFPKEQKKDFNKSETDTISEPNTPPPPPPPLEQSVAEDIVAIEEVSIARSENEPELSEVVVMGYAAGLDIENSSNIALRGASSINNASNPIYIVDGIVTNNNPLDNLPSNEIESVQVLKAENAMRIFGNQASSGAIVITTKNGMNHRSDKIEALNELIDDKIELKAWNPETPYIQLLEKSPTIDLAYAKYLEIRDDYANSPSFYIDVADFFDKKGEKDIAIMVLTNLIEVDLDNPELLRALAYKLEYFNRYDLAVEVYKSIQKLRLEEPQSYRDLALAYENQGKYQKSFDLLYKIYNADLQEKDLNNRFNGIEHIAFVELTRLINKYPNSLDLSNINLKDFPAIKTDVRVVIDWNHNDTDIDLWVTDPNREKAFYENKLTHLGGRMSNDMTQGYGPEEFLLKNAIKGNYKIEVNYYADSKQKISGPTILKATLFTNYGRENEQKQMLIIRLSNNYEDIAEIGTLKF